jgi:preprotein translocase subunit SecY
MLQTPDRRFYGALAITALVLLAYRIGCHLPLPGLNGEQVAQLFEPGVSASERVSILALGVGPLFTALILFEIAKILFPSLRRWELASAGNRFKIGRAVILLALAVTAVQAIGYAVALENVANVVEQPGTWFRISTTLTLVGATALIVGMARVIDREGIGYGIWLLFLVPVLAKIPGRGAVIHELISRNEYALSSQLFGVAVVVAAIAAVVGLLRAKPGWPAVGPACLWPLLIAYTALPSALLAIGFALTGGVNEAVQLIGTGSAIRVGVLVLLIVGAVFLYARSLRLAGAPFPAGLTVPIALVLSLIVVADDVLPYWLGLLMPLGGLQIVVATVIATGIMIDWGFLPRAAADDGDAAQSPGLNR